MSTSQLIRAYRAVAQLAFRSAPVLLLGAGLLLLPACTTVEGSGRKTFNAYSVSEEQQMGEQAYPEMLKGTQPVTSGPQYDQVMRVANRITETAKKQYPNTAGQFQWQWTVIQDDATVNAWALPGGKCAVYTGLLKVAGTDDELAVVLGHECAHAIARHGGEQMTRQQGLDYGSQIAAQVGAALGDPTGGTASSYGAQGLLMVGVALPYSRKQESEADEIGLKLAAAAGYNPEAAIPFWTKMGQSGGDKPYELLSTHPSDETRVENLQRIMPEAMTIYAQSKGSAAASASGAGPASTAAPASSAGGAKAAGASGPSGGAAGAPAAPRVSTAPPAAK